jgi:hypothetical protein
VTISVAILLRFGEQIAHGLSQYSVYRVMSGGLLASAAASAAMVYLAALNIARRDF